jgi:hypothetical protein
VGRKVSRPLYIGGGGVQVERVGLLHDEDEGGEEVIGTRKRSASRLQTSSGEHLAVSIRQEREGGRGEGRGP